MKSEDVKKITDREVRRFFPGKEMQTAVLSSVGLIRHLQGEIDTIETMITKKLSEGHPNVLDVVNNGTVQGVVNTITGGRVPLKDGFNIRRAAAEKRIPCFTSLDTIRAVVEVLAAGTHSYSAQPLPSYRKPSAA